MRMPIAMMDVIMQLLICIFVVFVLDYIQPKSPKATVETPPPRSEFIVTVTWPTEANADIDIWAFRKENRDSFTFFRSRENDVFRLHNDNTSSEYGVVDGVALEEAEETLTIERRVKGTYMFSLHGYRVLDAVPVTIEIEQTSPYKKIFKGVKVLGRKEHFKEVPVFEFYLDKDGKFVRGSADEFYLRKIGELKK